METLRVTLPTGIEAAQDTVEFQYFQENNLWYRLKTSGFHFPIPVSDTNEGIFKATMKGIEVLRWVRHHVEFIKNSMESESINATKTGQE
jgi:hypothetical protein